MTPLAVHGLNMHIAIAGEGRPLLLLHGFTGSGDTWAPLLPALTRHARTLAVDLIGHGRSDAPSDPTRYGMEQCAGDLLAALDELGIDQTDVLGYSMGGRVALHLATAAPRRIRALVLESASPGLADPAERAARSAADNALADSIERDGLEAFVDRWERLPLFASQASLPTAVRAWQRDQRLRCSASGLANSLRGMGTGQQASLWAELPTLQLPTLIITGALDHKFCAVGQAMATATPRARYVEVPAAGHAVHLEQAQAFADTVRQFLATPEAVGPAGN